MWFEKQQLAAKVTKYEKVAVCLQRVYRVR